MKLSIYYIHQSWSPKTSSFKALFRAILQTRTMLWQNLKFSLSSQKRPFRDIAGLCSSASLVILKSPYLFFVTSCLDWYTRRRSYALELHHVRISVTVHAPGLQFVWKTVLDFREFNSKVGYQSISFIKFIRCIFALQTFEAQYRMLR